MTTLAIHDDLTGEGLQGRGPRPFPCACAPLTPVVPRSPISIRAAVDSPGKADFKFIDQLQKKHSKMVGFMPTAQIENNIIGGHVLIAEDELQRPIGYCIYRDRYFKREDCGIIFHLNVAPGSHRKLVGAALVKAAFDRSAYGVKLYCCWCAQDIEANHFWEALGFVPIAFRAGSRPRIKKSGEISEPGRTHIFWQRRIREGDTDTPYWFPSETSGGLMRENRIALPIPPGSHWSDAMPMVLPGIGNISATAPQIDGEVAKKPRTRKPKAKAPPAARAPLNVTNGLRFGPPPELLEPKPAKPKPQKLKNDPKFIAAARELRDRYLEEVNSGRMLPSANGKYDVSRQLDAAPSKLQQSPLLDAA